MPRKPELRTPFGRLAWDLYIEEIVPRIADLEGGMGMAIKGFLDSMEDDLVEFAEAIDQNPDLQAGIIERIERALAEVKADQSEGVSDAEETRAV